MRWTTALTGLLASLAALTACAHPAWAADLPTAPTTTAAPPQATGPVQAPVPAPVQALGQASGQALAAKALSLLHFDMHGMFRARYANLHNVPVARLDPDGTLASAAHTGRDDAADGHFVYSRLRLDPTLRWGGDPGEVATKMSLNAQIDLLDNVVWGDNARQAAVPLFASNPGTTGIQGTERPSLFVRRLWLEVATPVGQVRAGRMGSQGGLGIFFNDGNGLRNDFGDAHNGSTFDRVLFATRPLTIWRALQSGDRRETPLIWLVGHDWLVEDPLGFGSKPAATTTRLDAGPYGFLTDPTCGGARQPDGTTATTKCNNDVGQWVTGLVWKDTAWNFRKVDDELQAGVIYVLRTQDSTRSRMHIIDGFWRVQVGLTPTGPSLLTEGEVATIQGETQGLKLLPGGTFDETTGLAQNSLKGDILNWVGRLGVTDTRWDALAEVGHSSGDEQLIGGDRVFKMFPMNTDYKMGLLMFPVALWARSSNTMAAQASDALQGGGGVFNATYLNVKGRYRVVRDEWQLELVGQGVLGWADTLNGGQVTGFTADYYAPRDAAQPWANNRCDALDPACALGWEVDVAAKLKWLPYDGAANQPGMGKHDRYLLHWSNEFGLMQAGKALAPRLADGADTLWTLQSRIALVW